MARPVSSSSRAGARARRRTSWRAGSEADRDHRDVALAEEREDLVELIRGHQLSGSAWLTSSSVRYPLLRPCVSSFSTPRSSAAEISSPHRAASSVSGRRSRPWHRGRVALRLRGRGDGGSIRGARWTARGVVRSSSLGSSGSAPRRDALRSALASSTGCIVVEELAVVAECAARGSAAGRAADARAAGAGEAARAPGEVRRRRPGPLAASSTASERRPAARSASRRSASSATSVAPSASRHARTAPAAGPRQSGARQLARRARRVDRARELPGDRKQARERLRRARARPALAASTAGSRLGRPRAGVSAARSIWTPRRSAPPRAR